MLFKAYHVEPILDSSKTQTRRMSLAIAVKPGTVFTATTNYSKAGQFARLRCLRTWVERLGDISDADARAELCQDAEEYRELFNRVNQHDYPPETHVRAYEFELVKVL